MCVSVVQDRNDVSTTNLAIARSLSSMRNPSARTSFSIALVLDLSPFDDLEVVRFEKRSNKGEQAKNHPFLLPIFFLAYLLLTPFLFLFYSYHRICTLDWRWFSEPNTSPKFPISIIQHLQTLSPSPQPPQDPSR